MGAVSPSNWLWWRHLVDVPATLSVRAWLLTTGGGRKTDTTDALSVAQVALHRSDLRIITPEDQTAILRLLTERRDDLTHERTRFLNRLLRELIPQEPPRALPVGKTAALLRTVRPATATQACRRDLARDLLADLRRTDQRFKDNDAQTRDALAATLRRSSTSSLSVVIGRSRALAIIRVPVDASWV